MKRIDLFSDTATRPTEGMLRAMVKAPVGDEQRRLDPTVIALEERVAELLGKEDAVFLPSTTMANQIALKVHTQPGDEVILEAWSHPVHFEAGGAGLISGVLWRTIETERGIFTPKQVRALIRPDGPAHLSRSRLVWVENTHNMGGGTVWPPQLLQEVCRIARGHGLSTHLDGARLLNASIQCGRPAHELAAPFDTVSFCLTKGLGAPVGGLLAGDRPTIARARRYKQALGGAMRQAGVIAAAGLYALEHHVERLALDHRRARRLAEGLALIPGIEVDLARVETNIVFFDVKDPRWDRASFVEALGAEGVDVAALPHGIRAVTHLDVDDEDIERAIAVVGSLMDRG